MWLTENTVIRSNYFQKSTGKECRNKQVVHNSKIHFGNQGAP